ncbi:hypothetical protein ABZ845_05160 [Streptomyces sp. NPDC047022]|uniref:hypothetical protein n=1 Tax=Streptomyces sp. NPDC047022 TaxID=3155737 RepID=UPI0033FB1389
MPADEVTHGTDVDASRARTGPRHAAPRKPLFTRFHMPAGKAMALAAMPTAVFLGMGVNSTLARADDHPTSKSLTADEYQKCVEALDGSKDASSSPSPSATPSASSSSGTPAPAASPSGSATKDKAPAANTDTGTKTGATPDKTSSSDSGSDGKATSTPSPSASSAGTSTPSSSSSSKGGLLGDIGNAITGVLTGGSQGSGSSASSTPTPSASASATKDTASDAAKDPSSTVTDTAKNVTDTVKKTVKDTATKAASEAAKTADNAVKSAESATPSPSASSTADAAGCPTATDDQGGVENAVALPDSPWHLEASSLTLKGADYQGVVKVRTANGTIKRVLKYVISDGTDIGDLHQLVDGQKGEIYHVQAGKGTTSTIRDGKTVMYTESISGNLFGLIPMTFDPDNPPPLNIPLIYFTKVKVTQAGQFGGTLHVPGMHQYVTGAS